MWKKFKEMPITYPVAIMFAICLVITAALAGTNALTVDKIAEINKENENKAMARLIKADEYKADKVECEDGKSYDYYEALKGDETEGFILTMNEKGYGGTVSVMVAVDTEGAVKAVEVLDVSNETPGLGQNAKKESFTKQFEGKSSELTAKKYGTATGDTEINAVASATITSRAVTKAVNEAVEVANEIIEQKKTENLGLDTITSATPGQ